MHVHDHREKSDDTASAQPTVPKLTNYRGRPATDYTHEEKKSTKIENVASKAESVIKSKEETEDRDAISVQKVDVIKQEGQAAVVEKKIKSILKTHKESGDETRESTPKKGVHFEETVTVFSDDNATSFQDLQQKYSEFTIKQKQFYENPDIAKYTKGHRTIQSAAKHVHKQLRMCLKAFKERNVSPDFGKIKKFLAKEALDYLQAANFHKNKSIVDGFMNEIDKQIQEAQKKHAEE